MAFALGSKARLPLARPHGRRCHDAADFALCCGLPSCHALKDVLLSRFDASLSTDTGDRATRDLGVSPDWTHTSKPTTATRSDITTSKSPFNPWRPSIWTHKPIIRFAPPATTPFANVICTGERSTSSAVTPLSPTGSMITPSDQAAGNPSGTGIGRRVLPRRGRHRHVAPRPVRLPSRCRNVHRRHTRHRPRPLPRRLTIRTRRPWTDADTPRCR